jgi:hypothetical protein
MFGYFASWRLGPGFYTAGVCFLIACAAVHRACTRARNSLCIHAPARDRFASREPYFVRSLSQHWCALRGIVGRRRVSWGRNGTKTSHPSPAMRRRRRTGSARGDRMLASQPR